MSLLELLAHFLEQLFCWLPRPLYCPKYEAIVMWTGKRDPTVKQGLMLYIPLFQDHERIDLREFPTEFEPKVLWTKDGKEVAVGMVVLWHVLDPLHCGERMAEVNNLVSKIGESILPELVGRFTLDEFKRKAAGGEGREWAFDQHLKTALNQLLEYYGIIADKARLNFTSDRVRTFKLIGATNELSRAWVQD